jgi:hypothetical protein
MRRAGSRRSALQLVQRLSVGERLRLALRGNKEVRSILIRDGARTVAMNVLDNPRLSEGEIEQFAKSKQVGEDVLREIAKNREWCRSYGIVTALTGNPKTPPGVALPLLNQMKKKDLENLEKNKNVSEAVRAGQAPCGAKRTDPRTPSRPGKDGFFLFRSGKIRRSRKNGGTS